MIPFWPARRRPPVVIVAALRDGQDLAAIHATGFERGWDATEFERLLADARVVAHLARPGGRGAPSGFALSRIAADEAEVLTVAVRPSARGAGVARAILAIHFARLAALGARAVFLEVAEDNAAALRLYRGLGFAEVGRRGGYYARAGDTPVTALVMHRPLG